MAIRKRKKMPPSLTPTGALNKQAAKMVAAAEQAVSSLRNKMFGDMYLHAIRQHVSGNSVPLKFLKELREIPVSIETFIDSPDFFGATDLVLWPEVRKAIVDINSRWWKGPKDAYTEVVLMGATSTGKSEIAKVTTAYHIYLLGCMKAPQQYYGLPQATSIVFMIQAAKTHVTKKVIYMPLRNYIETMPWFQRHMRPDRLLEAEMYFPELNVRVVQGGADSDTVLGEAIIGGIIDEINFMNVVTKSKKAAIGTGRSGTYDQAQSVYDTITRRRKGRFLSLGPQIGTICVASSTRYKGDFTDRRKQHVEDNKIKTVYIYDRAQYDVWPQDRYSGEKFRLLVANESAMDIRILEDNEKALGCTVLEIPVEYIDDFRRDPAGSLRDVVGSSVNSINPFFRQQNKIMDCVAMGEHTGLATFLQKDNVVLGFEGLPVPVRGHYCKNPSKPRYVHIDLSSTSDRCGVAMLRVDGMEWVERLGGEPENLPIASVEMAVTFEPDHGNEIDIAEVRSWVRMLKTQYGYPIRAVTYDGWNCQSVASDVWTSRGLILAGEVKVGDVVQTRSGPQPVEKVWRYGKAPTLVVNTKQGHTYEITHGHKLEILDRWDWSGPRNDRKPVWGWCRADQIQEGDIVRTWDGSTEVDVIDFYPLAEVPDHFASNSNPMLYQPAVLNENVARFIGLMFGDGNFNKVSLTLTCTEEDCDNAYSIITSAVDLESYGAWSPIKGANVGKIQIGSSHLLEWLRHNRLADKTGVPEAIRRSPLSVQAAFISGLFSADGSVKERDGQVSIEQRNENYIKYLMHILSMGFGMRVNKTYRSPRVVILPQGSEYKTKGSYILQIQGSRKCFYERIGFAYDSKQRQLFTHLDVPGRFIYSKVASITESMAEVVDFQIAEDHSYLANGFVSHNSLESRQAWKKQGMKTAAVSVDRSDVPYKQLRDAIYDNRLRLYHQPILIEELFGLEYDEKDKKIDHPVNGGKDCISGDTEILLLDGSCRRIDSLVGEEFWVYSSTLEGRVTAGRAHNVHKVGTKPIICVYLDNGEYLKCTEDHEIMLRDGSFTLAGRLKPGDSLMPLYTEVSVANSKSALNGYERIRDNDTGRLVYTHQRVGEDVLGFTYGRAKGDRKVLHHIDFDKRNNSPDNLIVMGWADHRDLHNKLGKNNLKRLWKNEDFVHKSKCSSSRIGKVTGPRNLTRYNKSRERVDKLREDGVFSINGTKTMTKLWEDQGFRERHKNRLSGVNSYQYRSDISFNSVIDAVHAGYVTKKDILKYLQCGWRTYERALADAGYTVYDFAREYLSRARAPSNHKVVRIEVVDIPTDVYDMTVDVHHNFAIKQGIFVHNCADAVCGAYYTLLTRSSSWVMAGGSTTGPEEMPYDDRPDLGDRFEPERA